MSLLETFNWAKAAEALSNEIPLERLHPEVLDYLCKHLNEPWGITCSGGADSLSLLLLIYQYFFDKVKELHVFHYNHKLRGAESDGEEELVRTCAAGLKLQLIVGKGSELIKDRSENNLRKNRHQFFNESLKATGGKILLLGHQRDDVGEMILMRLARGSGTGGLCAPRPVHHFQAVKVHLRPLLKIGKVFLLEKLNKAGITWCDDSSNEGEYYFRNRIRRNVIPEWQSACVADIWKGIEKSRSLLEEDDMALEFWIEDILGKSSLIKGAPLQIGLFEGKPKALYRRILHKWLNISGISKNFNAISFDRLLDTVMKEKGFFIKMGRDYELIGQAGLLTLKELKRNIADFKFIEQNIEPGISIALADDKFLKVKEIVLSEELKDEIFSGRINPDTEAYFNYDNKLNLSFIVRLWKDGDRYRAIGSPGSRKLQDMFIDRKIAIEKRRILPIICEKQLGIVWCPGLPIAESLKVEANTTVALKLTFG